MRAAAKHKDIARAAALVVAARAAAHSDTLKGLAMLDGLRERLDLAPRQLFRRTHTALWRLVAARPDGAATDARYAAIAGGYVKRGRFFTTPVPPRYSYYHSLTNTLASPGTWP